MVAKWPNPAGGVFGLDAIDLLPTLGLLFYRRRVNFEYSKYSYRACVFHLTLIVVGSNSGLIAFSSVSPGSNDNSHTSA
jgi:hypothetical protein